MQGRTGRVEEHPVESSFREGLTVPEFILSAYGSRRGASDGNAKTAFAGYFTRRLVEVGSSILITEKDCGIKEGLSIEASFDGSIETVPLSDKLFGRTLAKHVKTQKGKVRLKANTILKHKEIELIERMGLKSVTVRSPTLCLSSYGVCSLCYGMDLSTGKLVKTGEPMGIVAAQAIGEPGTQLSLNTVKAGGTASQSTDLGWIQSEHDGTLEMEDMDTITGPNELDIVISRKAKMKVVDSDTGKYLEIHAIPYGAVLLVVNGSQIETGDKLARWNSHTHPIIGMKEGKVVFDDSEGSAITNVEDPLTGLSKTLVKDVSSKGQPVLSIVGSNKEILASYNLAEDVHVLVENNSEIQPGTVLAEMPKAANTDISLKGGLQKLTDLFEMRTPADKAVFAHTTGKVEITKNKRGATVAAVVPRKVNLCGKQPYPLKVPRW